MKVCTLGRARLVAREKDSRTLTRRNAKVDSTLWLSLSAERDARAVFLKSKFIQIIHSNHLTRSISCNHGEMTEDLTPKTEIQYGRIGNKSAWQIFSV